MDIEFFKSGDWWEFVTTDFALASRIGSIVGDSPSRIAFPNRLDFPPNSLHVGCPQWRWEKAKEALVVWGYIVKEKK